MTTTIEHFENGKKHFNNEQDFIIFMKGIFEENEENNDILKPIETYEQCLIYLMFYCANFELIYTGWHMKYTEK